jgi:hypothetical protein
MMTNPQQQPNEALKIIRVPGSCRGLRSRVRSPVRCPLYSQNQICAAHKPVSAKCGHLGNHLLGNGKDRLAAGLSCFDQMAARAAASFTSRGNRAKPSVRSTARLSYFTGAGKQYRDPRPKIKGPPIKAPHAKKPQLCS